MFDDAKPIFLQLAEKIADDILRGTYAEDAQVPSTNEFAAFYRINPATAGKGVNLLVDRGVLYKKRGIGMFVAPGARAMVTAERDRGLIADFITPLIREARALGISTSELLAMIQKEAAQ
ncbi:GntR family transcriptional regulator [Leucobacter sp. M11]|uniref:GntR family transcriptional regulator n=1 Tax=Leucobacter sp. M11 TaxID=2993565 RepID=UPI002D7E4C90|nr:GntR family transcriptional regulator [Leucobacter sp. M11]MEB4614777.1 GntR family transcriptional regulator [Leucobacter sp. M11]